MLRKNILLFFASCSLVCGQSASPNALAAAGRVLLTQLKGDTEAQAAAFRQIGPERAESMLSALSKRGQEQNATLDDWSDLHGALKGLVSLERFRGNPAKAATYAFLDDAYYRTHEEDYEAGLVAARLSLELQRKAVQPEFLQYKAIADDLFALGRLPEALQNYREAEKRLPDSKDQTAAGLKRRIVELLITSGDWDAARAETADMRRIAETAVPLYQARAKLAESDVLAADKKYEAAIDAVRSAIGVVGKGEDDDTFVWEAAAQVSTLLIEGLRTLSYDEATALARTADARIQGLPFQVAALAQQAIRQRRRLAGDLDPVLREDTARVEAARKSGNKRGLSEALRSLAASFAFVNGNKQRASILEEAAELQKELLPAEGAAGYSSAASNYLSTLNQLANAYLDLHQGAAARRTFEIVLKYYAGYTSTSLQNDGRRYQEQALIGKASATALDEPDDARDLLQKALRSVGNTAQVDVLLAIAQLERELNEKPAAAVEAYEKAIAAMREAGDFPGEIATRLSLARYLVTGAVSRVPDARKKAETNLAAAETIARQVKFADAGWRIDYLYGALSEADKPEMAMERYKSAVTKLDGIRAGLTQEEQRQSFVDDDSIRDLYARLVSLLSRAGQHEVAWQYLERSKARTFVEMLQGRKFSTLEPRAAVAEVNDLEKRIGDLRFELSGNNAGLLRSAGREPALLRQQLKTLETRFTVAREAAALVQSRSGQVIALQPPTLAAIQKVLPRGGVLIEYGVLEGELTAFVITASSFDQLVWKAETKGLRQRILRMRTALADPHSEDWSALIAQMSKTLIAPILEKLPKTTTQLLIVPTGNLNYIPFGVLQFPDGRPVMERYPTTLLPTAATLVYLGGTQRKTTSVFLGALGNTSVDGMAPLPGTLAETKEIGAIFPAAKRVEGSAFTHDEARRALTNFDTAHFATHGVLEEDAPLFSALVTSPEAGQPSRLSLYEVVGMPLQAKLVVLSACETGLGKLSNGDEFAGLTRTFLTAGADAVVSSLWKVSDDSTALLMKNFYQRLREGSTPSGALRESALAVRAQYPHPFYWAPFVVNGRN